MIRLFTVSRRKEGHLKEHLVGSAVCAFERTNSSLSRETVMNFGLPPQGAMPMHVMEELPLRLVKWLFLQ